MTGPVHRLRARLDELRLVDHHTHSVVRADLDRTGLEALLTEAHVPIPAVFDTPLGVAVRRWCAPVLDLPAHADAAAYVERRADLGRSEVTGRMLRASELDALIVDIGFRPDELLDPASLGDAAGAAVHKVVRVESVAEELARAGVPARQFASSYRDLLRDRSADAVGLKTIAAYRTGLDVPALRPTDDEVRGAAERWLSTVESSGVARLDDPTLIGFAWWCAVDTGLPLQVHTGFGDPDETLRRADPACMQEFLDASATVGTPIVLLHCYPYHRQAAYLAHVYPHVYFDVGLATNYVAASARTVIAEAMELAPYGKFLYSSDAFGLPELHYLGAVLFRRSLAEVLAGWVDADDMTLDDALRYADLIGAGTARTLYHLP
jgi:hypothetical protein